jgi:hypothetical protein
LTLAEKKKPPPRKEVHSITKPTDQKQSVKKPAALPTKDGAPDQAIYAKFAAGSLWRRVWDAIVSSKRPRCNEDHLRIACPKPRQAWEDNFEQADFFTRKYTKPIEVKKTVRVQTSRPFDWHFPNVLWITCAFGRCLVDTGSDVSTGAPRGADSTLLVVDPFEHFALGGRNCYSGDGHSPPG